MTRRPPNPFSSPGESTPPDDVRDSGGPAPDGPPPAPDIEERRERPDPTPEEKPPPPPFAREPAAREDDAGKESPSSGPAWPTGGAETQAEGEAPHHATTSRLQRGTIPVFDTLREAASLVNNNRRTVLMPLVVVTIPIAAIASLITIFLFLSIWSNEPVVTTGTLNADTPGGIIFIIVLITAVEALFAQVARAATVVAIAGVAKGNPPTLTEALDPAFNRIGGILVLIAVVVMIVGIGLLTVIGLVIMPYLLLRLAIAFDAYMIEGGSPWDALGRSWSLMQGNMLRLLGLLGLAAICVLPFFVLISVVGGAIDGGRNVELLLLGLWGIVQAAVIVPVVAFFTACTTLYYLKTRAIEDATGPA